MDFYSNDLMLRAESRRRQAELHRNASRALAPRPGRSREREQWTREFAAWIVRRAKIGGTFMARTPMNP